MKTRKILSALLALAMLLTASSAAFADNGISGDNSITVSYNTAENYEIIIPVGSASIGSPTDLTIEAVNVRLPEGKELQVSISSANGFALQLSSGEVTSVIPYSVTRNGSSVSSGEMILSVPAGETSGEVTLVASVNDASSAILAGTHTDTLRFTCEVADALTEKTGSTGSGTETTTTSGGSSSLINQNPTLGGDVPYGSGERPSPEYPESEPQPEPPHPSPYQWQSY